MYADVHCVGVGTAAQQFPLVVAVTGEPIRTVAAARLLVSQLVVQFVLEASKQDLADFVES